MGDFAELNIRFNLKKDTPNDVIDVLEYMIGVNKKCSTLPSHDFFLKEKWDTMLNSFSDDTGVLGHFSSLIYNERLSYWSLCVRSIYRDRGEAELFFDWIFHYIDEVWLSFLGFLNRDEVEHPYLIYYTEKGIQFLAVRCDEQELGHDVINKWSLEITGN